MYLGADLESYFTFSVVLFTKALRTTRIGSIAIQDYEGLLYDSSLDYGRRHCGSKRCNILQQMGLSRGLDSNT
jgi:hypothetical protein